MNRWLPLLLLAAGLGVGGFFLWPYLSTPTHPTLAVNNGVAKPAKAPHASVDPTIQKLQAEYDAHQSAQPTAASRQVMVNLATMGPRGPLPAPLVEAWLHRMHEDALSETPEFHELAGALLAIDPEAPQRIVAEANRLDVVFDRTYQVAMLVAFGKACVPAVINGFGGSAGNLREAESVLPLVLARIGPGALPEVRDALNHPLAATRRQAVRTLALLGPDVAGPARPDLEAALRDPDVSVRILASLAVCEIGDLRAAPPAALIAALQDDEPVARLAAARSLARYPAFDRQQAAATVIALLKTADFTRPGWAMNTLIENKRPFAEAKGGLYYPALYWEETAAHVLIELGPPYQTPPESLVDMLKACPHDGRHIVHLLAMQGDAATKAVPALAAMVKDKDSRQRRKALLALGRLGLPRAAEALPEMRQALKHPDGRTRWRAFLALALLDAKEVKQTLPASLGGAVDAAAASAVHPRLDRVEKWTRTQWQYHPAVLLPATSEGAKAFKNFEPWTLSDEEVWIEKERVDAVLAAAEKAGPLGEAGVDFLLAAWQANNRTPSDRHRAGDKALDLLAREGAAAKAAVPAMVFALSWYETSVLAKAFVRIGSPAVPELAKALDNPDIQDLQPSILVVLREFGADGAAAVPAVVKLLNSPDENLAQLAAATLGSAGAGATVAVPDLQKLLASSSADTRRHAADALGLIGAPAKSALPDLIGLFNDDNQQLRVVAVRAVSRIGKDAVAPLTQALDSPSERVRLSAVDSLTRLGVDALPALPALRKLDRDDQAPEVRRAAQVLVKTLEGK